MLIVGVMESQWKWCPLIMTYFEMHMLSLLSPAYSLNIMFAPQNLHMVAGVSLYHTSL